MLSSHSSQSLSPSLRPSSLRALSVSAFSPLASPFDFELSTVNSLSPRSAHQYHSTALAHPLFSYSCALFCHSENDNLFTFRRFHTLCPKHPGWGAAIVNFFVAQISDLPVLPVTSNKSPVTTSALFPSPVTSHQSRVTKSFTIRTYERPAPNPFRIHTSKTQDLKPFRMNTYKKTGRGRSANRYRPGTSLAQFFKGRVGEAATLGCLFPAFAEHGARITDNASPVTAMSLLCREFAGGLGIRIELNSYGDRAFAARRKFPLPHRLFGGICQRRVSAQHLHILHRPIRVDGNLQSHRPANAPSLQDGRILRFHLLHYFALTVLRTTWRQAHQRQDEARDYRGVSNPALRFCHHAALKQRYGTPAGDHPHHCVFLCRTNVAVLSPSPRVFHKRVPQAHGTAEALDKLL
jgi:hypothetical protein